MKQERNLLFAVRALQAELIDPGQFVEACVSWAETETASVADLLVARGWIQPSDKANLNALLDHGSQRQEALASGPSQEPMLEAAPEAATPDMTRLQTTLLAAPAAASTADAEPSVELPQAPRGYEFRQLHATGGVGRIWIARDLEIGREVALKELLPEWAGNAKHAARFLQEARITGQLEHPGIVPVYALARQPETGRPFYTMRYVKGRTLSLAIEEFHQKRRDGTIDPLQLLNLLNAFVTTCNTIAYAHSRGVIHRDLKGQNVIVGDFGEVVVLDWGLAKRLAQEEGDDLPRLGETLLADPRTGTLTQAGQVLGTPAYMAPEQAAGRADLIDSRTDVYGLGAILYEIITGRPPFMGATTREIVRMVKEGPLVAPRELWPEVPAALEAVCLRALAKDPGQRYPSATELGREVQLWQDVQRRRAEEDLRQAFDRLMQQQRALVQLTHGEIYAGNDLIAIFRQLIEVAARTLGVERVSIWRFTPDRRAIRCAALYERSLGRHSAGMELSAADYPHYFQALGVSEVIAAEDARNDPRTREFTASYLAPLGIGAMMDVPIPPGALLCHEHVGPPRAWLPDEQLFGIAVAHLAANAISQWERRQAVEELRSARDPSPLPR